MTKFVQTETSQRLLPISIFDSLIHSELGSIGDYGQVFEETIIPKSTPAQFNSRLQHDSKFVRAIFKLYEIAMSRDVHLKFSDGTKADLEQSAEWVQGRSLCHFSDKYCTSSDYLMTLKIKKGETLNSKMLESNSTKLLGPETIKVLQEVGWDVGHEVTPIQFMDILPDKF